MKKLLVTSLLVCINIFNNLHGQSLNRGIAILDLNEEQIDHVDSQLFSAEHMVKVAGVPYITTTNVIEAQAYSTVLLTSRITASTFTATETEELIAYVATGGTLICPSMEDEYLLSTFGLESTVISKNRYTLTFEENESSKVTKWIDEPEELTVSLGRASDTIFKTYGYTTSTASTLALFDDGSAAVTSNEVGLGHAISFGLAWKDVILRNQLNRDYQAQRITSNGFEPSSDVFALCIRGLYLEHNTNAVWLHTSPSNSAATVIITHDVDSQTGVDMLSSFVDFEKENGIEATYNITTRYFDDALMGAFYTGSESTMAYIKNNGQAFGSHSVGHFFDYADEDLFPLGTVGNTMENYRPYNDGTATTGGTVYGECEVSKNILETDLDVPITFFRTGHLVYPKYLIDVLDDLGYLYNSSSSASDVLTHFPYQNVMRRSFTGKVSSVYELPVTISDVFHEDDITAENYKEKVEVWLDLTNKTMNNGSPTILLIHPNRTYKVDALREYYNALPTSILPMEITKYGDFWKAREVYGYTTAMNALETTLTVTLDDDLNKDMSFVISDGQQLDDVIVLDSNGDILPFVGQDINTDDVLMYYQEVTTHAEDNPPATIAIDVFPNPTTELISIRYNSTILETIDVLLLDATGQQKIQLFDIIVGDEGSLKTQDISKEGLSTGTYYLHFTSSTGSVAIRKIVVL